MLHDRTRKKRRRPAHPPDWLVLRSTFSLPAALLRLPHADFDGKLTVAIVRGRGKGRKVKEGDWIDADMRL